MMMCNVKGAACSDKPSENYHPTAVCFRFTKSFLFFQLIFLVVWPKTLLFWLSFATLVNLISSSCCFYKVMINTH